MGVESMAVAVLIFAVVTVLAPCTWAETGSGSLTQKVRRGNREPNQFWSNDAAISNQQLRQLLANTLSNSYNTAVNRPRDASQGYPYGSWIGKTTTGVDDGIEEGEVEREANTPRDATLSTSKRNGFFYGKRNGFFYGKRSGSDTSTNQCPPCGPQNDGQCVMFGTCCSYASDGCYFLTDDSLPCMTSESSPQCQLKGDPCGTNGQGTCVADSVCCSPQRGFCHIDLACSKPAYQ